MRGAQKVGFLSENLALCRSIQRPFANVSFFLLLRVKSRNPYFCSVFGMSRSGIVEKCTFLKTSKNHGQKQKLHFRHICLSFLGARNPEFVVFSRPQKGGVQLSSLSSWSDQNGVQLRTRKHIYIYISHKHTHWIHVTHKNLHWIQTTYK